MHHPLWNLACWRCGHIRCNQKPVNNGLTRKLCVCRPDKLGHVPLPSVSQWRRRCVDRVVDQAQRRQPGHFNGGCRRCQLDRRSRHLAPHAPSSGHGRCHQASRPDCPGHCGNSPGRGQQQQFSFGAADPVSPCDLEDYPQEYRDGIGEAAAGALLELRAALLVSFKTSMWKLGRLVRRDGGAGCSARLILAPGVSQAFYSLRRVFKTRSSWWRESGG